MEDSISDTPPPITSSDSSTHHPVLSQEEHIHERLPVVGVVAPNPGNSAGGVDEQRRTCNDACTNLGMVLKCDAKRPCWESSSNRSVDRARGERVGLIEGESESQELTEPMQCTAVSREVESVETLPVPMDKAGPCSEELVDSTKVDYELERCSVSSGDLLEEGREVVGDYSTVNAVVVDNKLEEESASSGDRLVGNSSLVESVMMREIEALGKVENKTTLLEHSSPSGLKVAQEEAALGGDGQCSPAGVCEHGSEGQGSAAEEGKEVKLGHNSPDALGDNAGVCEHGSSLEDGAEESDTPR
jgi:hypothetical protein